MGCDGGTIPTRNELIRLKKKPETKDSDVVLAAKWKHCALSQQLLNAPIVSCELGRLYNKDSIIELLLDRSKFEDPIKVEHIKCLKDVKELVFTANPAFKAGDDKAETYVTRSSEYICPITGLEMTGRYKFQFIWTCACVFAERALKTIKSVACNKCGKPFNSSDIITLNAEDEALEKLREAMVERRAKAKLEKKAKKKKAAESVGRAEEGSTSKKIKLEPGTTEKSTATDDPSSKLSNGTKAEKSAKIAVKKEEKKDTKFKSIQDNPNASKVFKSLFSTSAEAKSKGTAHWVTHNPFYN